MSGVIVEVAARSFAVPFECPCCGAVPDTEMVIRLARTAKRGDSARGLVFPYCTPCADHAKEWDSAGMTSAVVMLIAIVGAVVVTLATQLVFGLLVFLGAVPIAVVLSSMRKSSAQADCGAACASPHTALSYLGWSGTVSSFSFESLTYTARFAEQNAKLLNNPSPELRKLLEGYKFARLAVPTPAAPAMTIPPPLSAQEWITRIESHKGRVERRNALQRALEIVIEPDDRKPLIAAASKLDLAPLLGKVDRASSTAAKKRQLQEAIDEVRADNIPEPLQEVELAELETRLRELG